MRARAKRIQTWVDENHDAITYLFKVNPLQFHDSPWLCRAIENKDFKSFQEAVTYDRYQLSFPMFPEDQPVSLVKIDGGYMRFAKYCEDFEPGYDGSCLEYMIDNDYPIEWLTMAYDHWGKNSGHYESECHHHYCKLIGPFASDLEDLDMIPWPFFKAITNKDLDTFLVWKEHIGNEIYDYFMYDEETYISEYLSEHDYPSEWK